MKLIRHSVTSAFQLAITLGQNTFIQYTTYIFNIYIIHIYSLLYFVILLFPFLNLYYAIFYIAYNNSSFKFPFLWRLFFLNSIFSSSITFNSSSFWSFYFMFFSSVYSSLQRRKTCLFFDSRPCTRKNVYLDTWVRGSSWDCPFIYFLYLNTL